MHEITISPVTRANAVGAVTVMVEGGKVVQARSKGGIFRGFEMILKGRHPWDAPYLTQRICGICSSAHGIAACRALEAAAGAEIPANAVLLRNIIFGLDLLQNHLRHFYMLMLWDWVAPPPGRLFNGAYSADFRVSRRNTQKLHEHYWAAVEQARLAHEALTMLGGKAPHNHGLVPGGVTFYPCRETFLELRGRIAELGTFIEEVYLPDTLLLQDNYRDYLHLGGRDKSYLSFGLFQAAQGDSYQFEPGAVLRGRREEVDTSAVAEDIGCSWYSGRGGHPFEEEAEPHISGDRAYSWIKAPRYRGLPCEGGPLARARVSTPGKPAGSSVMERIVERSRESVKVSRLLLQWLEQLSPGEPFYRPFKIPSKAVGVGLHEGMRGPLSHWLKLEGGRIAVYQIITPSAWNFSPQDDGGGPGPVEEALLGLPVNDFDQPVEIGRVIRSFDPCYACSAHVICLEQGKETVLEL